MLGEGKESVKHDSRFGAHRDPGTKDEGTSWMGRRLMSFALAVGV